MSKTTGMDYESKPRDYYENEREEMLEFLPARVEHVLDVGCSNGNFGRMVKEKTGAEVQGIEPMKEFADLASEQLDKVYTATVEDAIAQLPDTYFDVIYCNDVLEHLVDPYSVLRSFKAKLKPGGRVISSIPNMRYFRSFFKLLFKGQWRHEDEGIMDRTHLRWFTQKSMIELFEDQGYEVIQQKGINASKSLKPRLMNLIMLGGASDMKYMQFATVAVLK